LGQLYAGKRRMAAIFAIPALLLLLVFVYQLRDGVAVFGTRFADPGYVFGALIILLALGVWRFAAVAHAFFGGERRQDRKIVDRAVLVALVAVIVISHGAGSYFLADVWDGENQLYASGNNTPPDESPLPTDASPLPTDSAGPTDSPTPTDSPGLSPSAVADGRITMLFAGMDAAPSSGLAVRGGIRYDAIMVVSFDPKTNSVQMVDVPREFSGFPLYYGGIVPLTTTFEINAMQSNLAANRIKSPNPLPPDGRFGVFVREIQYLVGIPIDYWVTVNLDEFTKVIDAIGGLDIVVPTAIQCAGFFWVDGSKGLYIAAGKQTLNGKNALAYARERTCDSDYSRIARQQQVMLALREKMKNVSNILKIPDLMRQAAQEKNLTWSSNFKPTPMIQQYLQEAFTVPKENFTTAILSPPLYAKNVAGASICPLMPALAAESIKLFGQDSLWNGKATPRNVCP
jgi:LCP family protein required for cell wall assembly